MAQFSMQMDDNLKKNAEQAFNEMGLTMTAAINVFLTKVARERRMPFELTADPFYSPSNIEYLEKVIQDIDSGKATLVEHDLIETE